MYYRLPICSNLRDYMYIYQMQLLPLFVSSTKHVQAIYRHPVVFKG